MILILRKIVLYGALLLVAFTANAQETWPSPEVDQMDKHAQEYMALGNYKDAITTYRQAIVLAPGKAVLYERLGRLLYLSGSYSEVLQLLQPLAKRPEAGEDCYWLLAASQGAQNNSKEARAVLKEGLERFPASGKLYNEGGILLRSEHKPEAALAMWLAGIQKAPAYPPNYYEAARVYMDPTNSSDKIMWGLLYGEIYLDIEEDTAGGEKFKTLLFTAYKTMFDKLVPGTITEFGKVKEQAPANSFIEAVQQVYTSLTPVVSDGITTENLTMVRTRFLMDWGTKYADKYPFSLFAYQDYLLRNGLFDIYNEWLFGKAESITEYNAWMEFHAGETDLFLEKRKAHALHPTTTDTYTDVGMDGMIRKQRR